MRYMIVSRGDYMESVEKYVYFNGLKFTRDDKTGYYLNSTIGKRLHRYVWEYHHGLIPKGYHVHHIDHNKSNNDISNLELMNGKRHVTLHGLERAKNHYEAMVENLDVNARPKAIDWHKSQDGRAWHKEHYEQMKEKLHKTEGKQCKQCGVSFEGRPYSKFCSEKCKAKWRRDNGLDDIEKVCEHCGEIFTSNKYAKKRFCSRSCAVKQRHKDNENQSY